MYWSIISDTEPSNHYTGKLWIRPGIAGVKSTAAFLKLGGSYIQVATTTEIPFSYLGITYLIDGEDKTALIRREIVIISRYS